MNRFSTKNFISWIFPLYIVLIYYVFGFGSIGEWLLIFLAIISFKTKTLKIKPLLYLIIFIIISDISLIFSSKGNLSSSFFNREIFQLIQMFSLFFVSNMINSKVLKKSIYILTIITCLGVIYHLLLISFGQSVSTISFVSFESSRFSEVAVRPLSIFPEPAAIISFLIIPLYILMNERKFFYSILLSIIILLTTSSTGVVYLLIMWSFFFYKSDYSKLTKLSTIFILSIIVTIFLTNDNFESSSKKVIYDVESLQDSDTESLEGNIRIFSGPLLFSTLSNTQLLFGLRSSSIDDYVNNTSDSSLAMLQLESTVFLPSFWLIWASYGIVGLLLYLYIFFCFYKKNKNLAPLMLVLFVGMFIQKIALGPVFIFYTIFLISETNYHNSKSIQL
jgi:hypothetical protein